MGVAQSGGPVAALGGAAALLEGHHDPLGLGVEPPGAAQVEDLRLAAEHGGDDAGLAGQSAGGVGGDRLAGVQGGGLQPAEQGGEVHGDHDRGVHPTRGGELAGGVALDQLAERLPQPLRRGPALTGGGGVAVYRGPVLGGGEREQGLLQHRGLRGRQGEPAVHPAVPVGGHGQPGRRGGTLFFLLELGGFVGLGGLGVEVLQDPHAPGSSGPWRRARSRTRSAAARRRRRTRPGTASTAAPITAAWSTSTSPAASAARSTGRAASAVASRILRCASVRVWWVVCAQWFAVEVAPAVSPTPASRACSATRSSSSATCADSRVSSAKRRRRLVGGHRPDRGVGDVGQRGLDGRDRPRHQVSRGVGDHRRHALTLPEGADISGPERPLSTATESKGFWGGDHSGRAAPPKPGKPPPPGTRTEANRDHVPR